MAALRRKREPEPHNPFVEPAAEPVADESVETDYLLGRRLAAIGPAVPTGSAWSANDIPALGVRPVTQRPLLWVVGLHGGAGVTTMVDLLGEDARDAKGAWPQPAAPPPARVVMVARTHHLGVNKAARAAREWAAGRLPWLVLMGLVLVDDSPKPPAKLTEELTQLAHMTPACWRIGWNEQWRSEPASLNTASRRTRKSIKDIYERAAVARDNPEPRRTTT